MKQFELKKIQSVPNSYSGGTLFYLFFNDGERSYKTCIDSRFRNYRNWKWLIENGKRGDRNSHISILINTICESEGSLIVNNNAAAVILMLNSISENKEIIVSRGQLVEIGGSFRIPDIMVKSNCKMVEVGTTNKTHIKDYTKAINSKTSAILYVHTSNYKVVVITGKFLTLSRDEIINDLNMSQNPEDYYL